MANLKDIRIRINSVRTTRQVTSAMKMVSAAKLKKAQDDVEHIRPFVGKLLEIVNFLGHSVDDIEERFAGFRVSQKGKVLIVPIASNKGLAGAFNSNVTKEVERLINTELHDEYVSGNVDITPIGKQVMKSLNAHHIKLKGDRNALLDSMSQVNAYKVASELTASFNSGEYKRIILVHNEFVNAAIQNIASKQLLPLALTDDESKSEYYDFIIEPNKEVVLAALVPQAINSLFYSTMLESAAAEHGARMTSMHKATDNATELLGELQLQYNKARQGAITNELIEIVSGAEALKN